MRSFHNGKLHRTDYVAQGYVFTSKSRLAVDREFLYIGSAGPGPGGRAEGRADGRMGGRAGGRTDGRAAGLILNDSTTIFIDFLKNNQKPLCFSVVSHPAEPHVSIFIAKLKNASKKHTKLTVFFDFSNHPKAQVPIFTPKMKNFGHAPGSTGSSGSTGSPGNATRGVVHNPRNTRA